MLFPRINNIKAVIQTHPTFHPSSIQYKSYWAEQKKRMVEGFWFNDSESEKENNWRFAMPSLYFQANMSTIVAVDHKKKTTRKIRPLIRDVEWISHSTFFVADGFSGFELDNKFSSHRAIKDGREDLYTDNCYIKDENGNLTNKLKTYIDAYEYLKLTHPKPMGAFLYENDAKNFCLLGTRGLGKSVFLASMITHKLLTDGAKEYTEATIKTPNEITIFVGAAKADKSSNLLKMVETVMENLPGSFGKGQSFIPSPLYKQMAGTLNVNNSKAPYKHSYEVKENGQWNKKGSKSKILHELFTIENPQAAVGKRCVLVVVEEYGLLTNADAVMASNEPVVSLEGRQFGVQAMIGTGGNIQKIIESKKIFYSPKENNIVEFENVWEGGEPIGLFIPVEYSYTDLKDENGNTDFILAEKRTLARRKNKKWNALQDEKMNYPKIPSEMFIAESFSFFPQEEIDAQLKYIQANERKLSLSKSWGHLYYDHESSSGVSFMPDLQNQWIPLDTFPTKKGIILTGAVTIYEHPKDHIPENLYKVVYDPVRDDNIIHMDRGVSLAAVYVYKSFQTFDTKSDEIVAHYVGRLQNTDDIHEIAIKLALYYNAKILVEMDLPGFYKYCIQTGRTSILARCPVVTLNRIAPTAKFRYNVGVLMRSNPNIKIQAEQYLLRWLLQVKSVEYDEMMNIKKQVLNIHCITDKALLEELKFYDRSKDGNWDRVSSLLLLMLWIEETRNIPIYDEETSKTLENYNRFIDFFETKLYKL